MKDLTNKDETLKKVHETEIEILDEIVRICKKHGLKYYLGGGNLIGAARHKGFIPWDDDMDIGMTRDDYEKFLEIAPYELDDKYYLETRKYNKNFYLQFSKVKKNNTDFKEKFISNLDIHKGIFVDIFPYDNIKNRFGLGAKIRNILITYATQAVFVKYKLMKLKDCRRPFFCGLYQIFSANFIMKIQKYLMTMDRNKNTEYLCNFAGRYSIEKESFKRELLEQTEVEFEGKMYTTFKDYDAYLTQLYGDYMTLPPVSERVNHCPENIDFEHGKNIITRDLIKK